VVAVVGALVLAAVGCTAQAPNTVPPPSGPTSVSSTFPKMTGVELDRSLRSGADLGQSSLPPFGKLLASTEDGGPRTVPFDTTGFTSSILGVFVCSGEGRGPEVSVMRGDTSLLWFKSDGCDPGNVYSGRSQPIGGSGGPATLRVTASKGVSYSVVLEQVPAG
jgi:hypothetical protein